MSSRKRHAGNPQKPQRIRQESATLFIEPTQKIKQSAIGNDVDADSDDDGDATVEQKESVSLETALKNLEMETDQMFVDIVDGIEMRDDEDGYDEMNENAIGNLKVFTIEDVLPVHLQNQEEQNKKEKEKGTDDKQIVINEALFKMMSKEDIDGIDEIEAGH